MTNPKCQTQPEFDNLGAGSADSKRLFLMPINRGLFDHLVSGDQELVRHGEAEHPGNLGIDDQLEPARLHNGQVRWLCALEDAADINADLSIHIAQIRSVAHQAAGLHIVAQRIGGGDGVSRRQMGQLHAPAGEERRRADEESIQPFARNRCKGCVDLVLALRTWTCSPMARAAGSSWRNVASVACTLAGSTSTATRAIPGASSRRSSSRFATTSPVRRLIPVRLPPGPARLATAARAGPPAEVAGIGREIALALLRHRRDQPLEKAVDGVVVDP